MAETTGIAWTRSTFNPWLGCTKVGPGCDHCYAEVSAAARFKGVVWGNEGERVLTTAAWANPIRWQKECVWEKANGRFRQPTWAAKWSRPGFWPVFCASLADVFDNKAEQAWRDALWELIEATPDLTWQLLTKRIGNVGAMIPDRWSVSLPPNVWLGATIVNQDEANRDLPKLLSIKCHRRFVSYEPALGPIDWRKCDVGDGITLDALFGVHSGPADAMTARKPPHFHSQGARIHQVIVGGESKQPGSPARAFMLDWARTTVMQCQQTGVAPFVKQLGANCFRADIEGNLTQLHLKAKRAGDDPAEFPEDLRVQEFPI